MRRPESTVRRARAPKLATVAKAAEVSNGLASRVLNKDPSLSVRGETRHRVEAAAERLNYVPSASAQALRQQRTRVIGLAVHDLASTIVVDLLEGARNEATSRNYLLLLSDADEIAFHDSSRRLYLGGARIDGLIMQDGHADLGQVIDEISVTLPTVVFNTPGREQSPGIQVDERRAGRCAAEHLVDAGHRHIGFLGGRAKTYTNSARLEGVSAAVSEAGGTLEVAHGDWSASSGFASMQQLLSTAPGTTGIITANVLIGTGAMAAAHQLGHSVPSALSVVAVQDSWAVDFTTPRMTTVALPLRDLGRSAVRTLISYIGGEDVQPSQTVSAAPRIRRRDSVAAPSTNSLSSGFHR